jgi:hypothetical protein
MHSQRRRLRKKQNNKNEDKLENKSEEKAKVEVRKEGLDEEDLQLCIYSRCVTREKRRRKGGQEKRLV